MLDRRSFLVGSLAVAACGPARPAAAPPFGPWASRLDASSPLVGRIWDVARSAWVPEDELVRRLVAARHVLLGEQHDNLDHHRLQARLVGRIGAERRPSVVFEMIDRDRQTDLDALGHDLDRLPGVLVWEKSGWPAFSAYRPIFDAANAVHLPLVAGNLPRAEAKAIARGGIAAADPATASLVQRGAQLSTAQRVALAEELRASHCGHLPESMIEGMSSAQIARDATLADAMSGASTGAVLIAGAGHARNDRAVPLHLAARGQGPVVSLSFIEVASGHEDPGDYAEHWGAQALPFDLAWFTPRASDEDPCRLIGGRK